jgi:hypothetical protein
MAVTSTGATEIYIVLKQWNKKKRAPMRSGSAVVLPYFSPHSGKPDEEKRIKRL